MKPISAHVHHGICYYVSSFMPDSVVDMGGIGKSSQILECNVTDANVKNGMNCTDLPFTNNQFDIAMSIATLEHVGGCNNQEKFLNESIRVSTIGTVHWFPFGEAAQEAEDLKKLSGFSHPCILPAQEVIDKFIEDNNIIHMSGYVTCREHLLMLCCTFPNRVKDSMYRLIDEFSDRDYYGLIISTKGIINEDDTLDT